MREHTSIKPDYYDTLLCNQLINNKVIFCQYDVIQKSAERQVFSFLFLYITQHL